MDIKKEAQETLSAVLAALKEEVSKEKETLICEKVKVLSETIVSLSMIVCN